MSEKLHKIAIFLDPRFLLHKTGPNHPENPGRLKAVCEVLKLTGFQNTFISPEPAPVDIISLVHKNDYIIFTQLKSLACKDLGINDGTYTLETGDVQICSDSYEVARLAVGAVIQAVDIVMAHSRSIAFCAVRPPGHHATKDRGMGFCLFNNVAVGAKYLIEKYKLSRVLIVDWDVHHGNGTQDIFWNEPRVFYFSTHQYPLYPGTGAAEETGVGNILNVPIEVGSTSRQQVLEAYRIKLVQAMEKFKPEFIFISAGFDAHELDPLGGLRLKTEDYGTLTAIVKEIANRYAQGRIVSVLEGGYHWGALAESVALHVEILNA